MRIALYSSTLAILFLSVSQSSITSAYADEPLRSPSSVLSTCTQWLKRGFPRAETIPAQGIDLPRQSLQDRNSPSPTPVFVQNETNRRLLRFMEMTRTRYGATKEVRKIARRLENEPTREFEYVLEDAGALTGALHVEGTVITVNISLIHTDGLSLTESSTSGVRFSKLLAPILETVSEELRNNHAIDKVKIVAQDVVNYDLANTLNDLNFSSLYLGRKFTQREIDEALKKNMNRIPKKIPYPQRENYISEFEFENAMLKWEKNVRALARAKKKVDSSSIPVQEGVSSLTFEIDLFLK